MSLTIAFHIDTQIENEFMWFFVPRRSVGIKRMNQERASGIKSFLNEGYTLSPPWIVGQDEQFSGVFSFLNWEAHGKV